MREEILGIITELFNKDKEGCVTISYTNPLWENNKYGVSFTKGTFDNPHKIKFKKHGFIVYQTMGYSLVTGKHIYIPYHSITSILLEES